MGVDIKNVFTGAPDQLTTGAILSGPTGVELPESARANLPSGVSDSGYIGEDGLKLTPSTSTETIKDWSGATIREVLSEFTAKMSWTHLELSKAALENYFGEENVTVTPATLTTGTQTLSRLNASELPVKSWYFRIKDGLRRILIVVPLGQVTERGEINFTKSQAVALPVVMSTYPDSAGNNVYIYTDDGVFTA